MSTAATLQFSNVAEAYERLLVGPLFRPSAELLIESVLPGPDQRVLDVACGTGIVARLARARVGQEGRVVGVDVSPHMLAQARSVAPQIEWREGNAMSLPVEAGERFDLVTCHQGLQFVPDRPRALREMRRVLASGGRLAIGTWRPVEEMPFLLELQRVVERHAGPLVDTRHSLGDDRTLAKLLANAGFHDVRVEAKTLPIHFDDWTVFARLNAIALVGMSAASKQVSEEERANTVATIVAETKDVLGSHLNGNALTYVMGSNIATARG